MSIQAVSHTQSKNLFAEDQGKTNQQDQIQKVLMLILASLLQKLGNQDDQSSSNTGGGSANSPAASSPTHAVNRTQQNDGSRPNSQPATPTAKTDPTPSPASTTTAPTAAGNTPGATGGNDFSTQSVAEGVGKVSPKFEPVLRGDEKEKDAQIKTQADFGKAVDATAKEYGLDPNLFRAQLEVESNAFTKGFQSGMKAEGDLDRASENNTSIGMGQISRKFLDGREWSNGGPGNERVGSQVVSTAQYQESATVQMRMAASNLAQRVADKGGLENGLASYVSGSSDPTTAKASNYIDKINAALKDPAVMTPGR